MPFSRCATAFAAIVFLTNTTLAASLSLPSDHQVSLSPKDEEVTLLEPGKSTETAIAGGAKHSYKFELANGQYTTILVDCHGMSARIRMFDTTATQIDKYFVFPRSMRQLLELVAETTGFYGLAIENQKPQSAGQTCTIQLAFPRRASPKERTLQQARILTYQAGALSDAEKYDQALEPAQRAVAIRENELGSDAGLVAQPLYLLGNIFFGKTEYRTAETYYLRALRIQENAFGPLSDDVFQTANNLGGLYSELGELDKAEEFSKRAVDILERNEGRNAAVLGYPLTNLANVYEDKGNYREAEALYRRALDIWQKAFGPDTADEGDFVFSLANISVARGDYVTAEVRYNRAIAIYQKALGPDTPQLGNPFLGLGNVYFSEGAFDKAATYYKRARQLWEQTLGAQHPQVALAIHNLGQISFARRDFAKTEALETQSLSIREKKLGKEHPDVAQTLDSLATVAYLESKYEQADSLYRRALEIREKVLGPEAPDVVSTLTHMSMMNMARGSLGEAEDDLSKAIHISEDNAEVNLLSGSERQKLAYVGQLSSQLNESVTLDVSLRLANKPADELAVTTVLQRKGRVQDSMADTLNALRQRVTDVDRKLLDDFSNATSQLSHLILSGPRGLPPDEYQKRLAALKDLRETLEAEISARSAEFRAASQPVTLIAVRSAIPQDAVLLEFVSYRKFLPTGTTDTELRGESRYAAYVIRSAGAVGAADLGSGAEIDAAIAAYREALRDPKRNDVAKQARALDEKIFRPLREFFGETNHLLISPDGQLNLIPFEALIDERGRYALERYSITYLSTGRDLLRMQVPRKNHNGLLLVANPVFGEPSATLIAARSETNPRRSQKHDARRSITAADDLSSIYFAPLTGTAQEAHAIQGLFPNARLLTGEQANKAALKTVNAPAILHIATHGFFLTDTEDPSANRDGGQERGISASARIENPLLRSGLALAGANLSRAAGDDGILTAMEASNLNLWGTQLVTLSACDTGVGEVKNGEGVFGLRRAFFLAGTESLVMSLWPVSDYVTRELMIQYYAGLKKGLGRGEALRQAQLTMMKKKGREHPFYWASFIEAGEWANLDGQRTPPAKSQ